MIDAVWLVKYQQQPKGDYGCNLPVVCGSAWLAVIAFVENLAEGA
jgi:hypothetical protein